MLLVVLENKCNIIFVHDNEQLFYFIILKLNTKINTKKNDFY